MKKLLYIAMTAMLAACSTAKKDFDATGTFEAQETVVSAQQNGQILAFNINEGDKISEGFLVGVIDTSQIFLKIRQLEATKEVYQSQKPDTEKQMATLKTQLLNAEKERQRFKELVADGAMPAKALDDADNQVQVIKKQLDALSSSLNTNTNALSKQSAAADAQILQLKDQLLKCRIVSPKSGTVLEKYTEQGEFAAAGKPLFKIADTDRMFIRAYLSSSQLQKVQIGQKVKVYADYGDAKKEYDGTVSWISQRSEFTPKTILTDDERADLVYAVKIAVQNDGFIKIGMYGEVDIIDN